MDFTITTFKDNTLLNLHLSLKKAAGVDERSAHPRHLTATLMVRHVYEIAKVKQSDPFWIEHLEYKRKFSL